MATCTKISKDEHDSVLDISEEAVETPCTICTSRGQTEVESKYYCVDCDSNMCKVCTEFHANFPPMASHEVVGISRTNNARETRLQLPTQRCKIHHNELIERFCVDHMQLACNSCVSQDHRKCENLKYIPVFSKGVKKSQELRATKTSTESVLRALKEFQYTQQKTLRKLDTMELQSQQALQSHRDKLVKCIDKLAKADSAKITSKFQEAKHAVKQSVNAVVDQISIMEAIVKGLKQATGDNEPDLFVCMKQGQLTEQESNQLLDAQQQSCTQIPKYKVHTYIEKFLSDVKTLGQFETVQMLKPQKLMPVNLQLRGEYKVRAACDKSNCDINGTCLLPDGSLMVTDWDNTSLKQLDSSYMYRVINSLDMGTRPYDVCYIDTYNEVAVTLIHKKTVQFVCVEASLKKTRSFSVGDYCKGITSCDEELFICCGSMFESTKQTLRVFSLAGNPLRIIQHDTEGNSLFLDTRRVTISSCGNHIYVTDWNKGVITIDRSGNVQQQFHHKGLRDATGICTLANGDLLVGGYNSNNVMHVSKEGKKLAVVLGEQDGLVKPQALLFDSICSRFIVTTCDCNMIKVYNVS